MSLQIKNTNELTSNFLWKVLIYGLPGAGKTKWVGTAPGVGIGASETGHGKGMATLADQSIPYVEIMTIPELEMFCDGKIFTDNPALALDSYTSVCQSIIKDRAVSMPRKQGNSPKRAAGVPELDDYGVMGELGRKYLRNLLSQPKHIILTATAKLPFSGDPEKGDSPKPGMPNLPGELALGITAMVDTVMFLDTRSVKSPDGKGIVAQRFFRTQTTGPSGYIAKSRLRNTGLDLLDKEEIFDISTGQGTFTYLLDKIVNGLKSATSQ